MSCKHFAAQVSLIVSITAASSLTIAQEIRVEHEGLILNANLQLIDGQPLNGDIALITHGTLAHNGMEIIQVLQELLADEEIPSLALNLSLGVNDRHGMYDCATPHNHAHTDAVEEIGVWQQWLINNGAEGIILMGHSRGGNQTAWFANENSSVAKAQILIAPATWDAVTDATAYQNRYQQALAPLLTSAKGASAGQWLENTGFIYCQDSKVSAGSFVSYYQPDTRFDTPTLLQQATLPSLVIIGSDDHTVSDLQVKMPSVNNDRVQSVVIEGADHYFRDLYADEVIENITDFLGQL
ncbi:alpha/beta hydrolase [Amphritea sp. HPY]|uniref:alpha/beta hydrolase n=1 Tax=Amphritea sp. HPY TaxID=3421652 RepID=UPI003D7EDDDF